MVSAPPGSGGGGNDEDYGEKAKVGDYVTLPGGGYGKIESIDPTTGDADITQVSEPDLKTMIESKTGKTVKKIS